MRHSLSRLLAAAMACAIAFSMPAKAADKPALWLGGVEASSDNTYFYLGNVAGLAGRELGQGWARRLWLDISSYQYDKNGQTYEVRAPGVQAALGYQGSQADYWWGIYSGLAYRHSEISPDDLGSSVRGGMLRPIVQAEAERSVNSWKLGVAGSYIFGQRAYWSRVRLSKNFGAAWYLGVEMLMQGDPEYEAYQTGLILTGLRMGSADAGLKVGFRTVGELDSQIYAGIELGGLF